MILVYVSENMAKTLAMIKAHSASVKRRASMYSEIADTAGSNVSGISSLNRSPKTGKLHANFKLAFVRMEDYLEVMPLHVDATMMKNISNTRGTCE